MDRTHVKIEIIHRIVAASFSNPFSFPGLVDQEISRNRSLRSSERRELTDLAHDGIRWRRRIWGDIAPTKIEESYLHERLAEAKGLRHQPPLSRWAALTMDAVARELSFPTWIFERWVHQLGLQSAVSLALSMNEPAQMVIRANILKVDRAKLREKLAKEDVEARECKQSPWGLQIQGRKNLRALRSFKEGLFEAQDEGSQLAVLATGAKPGDLVVDACTGAGGKALALASMMKNSGKIVAVDSDSRVFPELLRRARRAGCKILESAWAAQDDPEPVSHLQGKADLVLVDAPCSGLGVLRRRPWTKWSVSSETADRYPQKQQTLLRRFGKLVKPGGRLAYITCTIHQHENEDVCSTFLIDEKEFKAENPPRLLRPDVEGCDGFFTALFRKPNGDRGHTTDPDLLT